MARKIAGWLKNILPENFAAKQAEFHQMEMFLKHYFKANIAAQIELKSCSSKRVVLAAKTPQTAGYIKLNQQDLEQQMNMQLNVPYRVLIKTAPQGVAKPIEIGVSKVKCFKRAADSVIQVTESIEDNDALKDSLSRLAKTIHKKAK